MTTSASKLRALLRADTMTLAPGAYDCITGRTVARAGFAACYMTGSGTAAATEAAPTGAPNLLRQTS